MANELQYLDEVPVEYIKQYFDQVRVDMEQISETELKSKYDYEKSRLDTKIWMILEKNRKARNAKMSLDVIHMKQKVLLPDANN